MAAWTLCGPAGPFLSPQKPFPCSWGADADNALPTGFANLPSPPALQ